MPESPGELPAPAQTATGADSIPIANSSMPLTRLAFGPVGFGFRQGLIEMSRLDSRAYPKAVIRWETVPFMAEVALVYATDRAGSVEKVIGRATQDDLERVFLPYMKRIQELTPQNVRLVTSAELRELGYSLVWMDDKAIIDEVKARTASPDGRLVLTEDKVRELEALFAERLEDSLYKPELLDLLEEEDRVDIRLLAVREDDSDSLWVGWAPRQDGGVWFAVPHGRVGNEPIAEAMEQIALPLRNSAGFAYVLMEIADGLGLKEWADAEALEKSFDEARKMAANTESYQSVVMAHHAQAYDIEHFYSIGLLSISAAQVHVRESMAGGGVADVIAAPGGVTPVALPRLVDLDGFRAQLTEHALSRLVENTEIALSGLKDRLTRAVYGSCTQEIYDKVRTLKADQPKQCLDAFRVAGLDESLVTELRETVQAPTELRHLWTHRGRHLDDVFFDRIGRKGQSPLTMHVFGRPVELQKGYMFAAESEDIRRFSLAMTGLLDRLCLDLSTRWPLRPAGS